MLFVVYSYRGQQEPQFSRQLNTNGPESGTIIAELRQRVQEAWDNLSQDDIRYLYSRLHGEYMPALPPEGSTLYIDVTV